MQQQQCFEYGESCSNLIYQTVDVKLPISLIPSVNIEDIKILCCDEPRVECCKCLCDQNGIELKITQTITYKIPIEYRVKATTGNLTSDFEECCDNTSYNQCR